MSTINPLSSPLVELVLELLVRGLVLVVFPVEPPVGLLADAPVELVEVLPDVLVLAWVDGLVLVLLGVELVTFPAGFAGGVPDCALVVPPPPAAVVGVELELVCPFVSLADCFFCFSCFFCFPSGFGDGDEEVVVVAAACCPCPCGWLVGETAAGAAAVVVVEDDVPPPVAAAAMAPVAITAPSTPAATTVRAVTLAGSSFIVSSSPFL